MFVLAMDNDTNKIVGIGMVRNHEYINKYTVYQNSNYNIDIYFYFLVPTSKCVGRQLKLKFAFS